MATPFKPVFKGWVRTIQDMERLYYGLPEEMSLMQKANDPVYTGTTGVRNIIYGSTLFSQVVTADNVLGALPKNPWQKSGYRAITNYSNSGSPPATGQAEYTGTQVVPDSIKPAFAVVPITPKLVATVTDQSTIEGALEGKDDTATWADIIDYIGQEFKNRMNKEVLANANTAVAGNNMESLDRICGSYSEVSSCGMTASRLDIYGFDRDAAASWVDAYVNHNSNTQRALSLGIVDSLFTNTRKYQENGMNGKILVTGYDTGERLEQLLQTQVRYNNPTLAVEYTVNGVKTVKGEDAGFDVVSYKRAPIIMDAFVVQDGISRIMELDLNYVGVDMLTPVQYMESEDYLALGKFAKVGAYMGQQELKCTRFRAQAKARDLL